MPIHGVRRGRGGGLGRRHPEQEDEQQQDSRHVPSSSRGRRAARGAVRRVQAIHRSEMTYEYVVARGRSPAVRDQSAALGYRTYPSSPTASRTSFRPRPIIATLADPSNFTQITKVSCKPPADRSGVGNSSAQLRSVSNATPSRCSRTGSGRCGRPSRSRSQPPGGRPGRDRRAAPPARHRAAGHRRRRWDGSPRRRAAFGRIVDLSAGGVRIRTHQAGRPARQPDPRPPRAARLRRHLPVRRHHRRPAPAQARVGRLDGRRPRPARPATAKSTSPAAWWTWKTWTAACWGCTSRRSPSPHNVRGKNPRISQRRGVAAGPEVRRTPALRILDHLTRPL